tara:strand:- start:58 stop:687 length:630 start_codon:yes stop_codon:yes gene_type:complete
MRFGNRVMSAFTALRQSTCHPHIVRRTNAERISEGESFREIMARNVRNHYRDWDQGLRQAVYAKGLQAAVHVTLKSKDLFDEFQPTLEMLRLNTRAAAIADVELCSRRLRNAQGGADIELLRELEALHAHTLPHGGRYVAVDELNNNAGVRVRQWKKVELDVLDLMIYIYKKRHEADNDNKTSVCAFLVNASSCFLHSALSTSLFIPSF